MHRLSGILNLVLKLRIWMCFLSGASVVLGQAASDVRAEEPIVLTPIKDGVEVALLIVPGAYINAAAYESLGVALQDESPLQLWIGLVRPFTNDFPNPVQCSEDIANTLNMMKDMGMNTSVLIVTGHSYGGVVMQDWIAENMAGVSAVVLMASVLSNSVVDSSSLPVLHISGDLDGLQTIFEMEPVFRDLEASAEQDPEDVFLKPVIVLDDVNHMHFASGEPPPLVESDDILSPLAEADAHALLAHHMSAFFTLALGQSPDLEEGARSLLYQDFLLTKDKLAAIAQMRELTASATSSPLAAVGQQVISNLDPLSFSFIYVTDTLYDDLDTFESHQPVTSLEGDSLHITTCSLVTDAGLLSSFTSPEELAIKFKSSEAIQQSVSPLGAEFLQSNATCVDVNQEALSRALNSGGPVVYDRYTTRGRPLLLVPDAELITGPGWLLASVNYTETQAGLAVQAASLKTGLGAPQEYAGMHYCKLMPPIRALEYVMVDSLRGTQPTTQH